MLWTRMSSEAQILKYLTGALNWLETHQSSVRAGVSRVMWLGDGQLH